VRAALLAAVALAGCAGESPCVDLPADCTPQYAPSFAEVHRRTLRPGCAQAGGACHASDGARGGLDLEDLDAAYSALIEGARVIPGDAACSPLMVRIESTERRFAMPPGAPLAPEVRCTIRRWIEAGAPR
jgi:hypothetical protein